MSDKIVLEPGHRRRAVAYAAVGNAVPVGIATATDFAAHRLVFFVGAVIACVAPIVVTAVSRERRVVFHAAALGGIPALTMMQAYSGGVASGYSLLSMGAVVWFGLQATRRELLAAMGVLTLCALAA